jgi:hypothetical protein
LLHWLEAVSQTLDLWSYLFVIHQSLITEMNLFYVKQIDPRHRYGHNLHFYYDKWLKSQSREPFFYW